jgi:hypothetical protein
VNASLRTATVLARKSQTPLKLLSLLGILVAVSCFWVATRLHPGGYNWNRDMISTLLRDPYPAYIPAVAGALIFCVSIALVFERLAHAVELSKNAKVIQIAGIGSMVYASLTFTPMHDLMVTISLIFFLVAALALAQALYVSREIGFFIAGCVGLAVIVVTATIYYTGYFIGHYNSALPWAQRASFALDTVWLVALDYSFPRSPLRESEKT